MRTAIGVIVACVVLFMWGFVCWGLGPYKTEIWKQTRDDATTGKALREHFLQNGTYLVPGFGQDESRREGLSKQGPVAMVHMLSVNGMPGMDPKTFVLGFVVNLIVIVLIAAALNKVAPALPTYRERVSFVTLLGLAAAILIDGGDVAWWHIDWQWKLYQASYDVSFWFLTGLILGAFVKPKVATPVAATEPLTP
jgi:hypothetical protein